MRQKDVDYAALVFASVIPWSTPQEKAGIEAVLGQWIREVDYHQNGLNSDALKAMLADLTQE